MLGGEDVNVLAHRPDDPATVFAGTYGNGLFRTTDAGKNWAKLTLPVEFVRALAFAPDDPHTVFAGAEPAELFVSTDNGDTWQSLRVRQLPEAAGWSLPYSPRRGALRSVALHPANPALIYGAVEQGGFLKSIDLGTTWSIHHDGLDKDVHELAIHPENPAMLFAATGGGLFATHDGGTSWRRLDEGYTRAVAIHPLNPDFVLAGPARDVGEGGRIIVSRNGGKDWAAAGQGLTIPLPDMVQHFVMHPALPQMIFAVRSGGGVLWSGLEPIHWHSLPDKIAQVQDLDVIATAAADGMLTHSAPERDR